MSQRRALWGFALGSLLLPPVAAGSDELQVEWPRGWHVERLEGASPDVRDKDRGYRLRATLGDDEPPRARIQVTCHHKGENEQIDVRGALDEALGGLRKGLEDLGFKVSTTEPVATRIGAHEGLVGTLAADRSDGTRNFSIAFAPGSRCAIAVMLAGGKKDYDESLDEFIAVKASIRATAAAHESGATANAADPLAGFPRACEAGKPKKRRFSETDFAPALQKLRAGKKRYVPRAWAMTCEYVVLCGQAPLAGACPRPYGAKPPFGNPINAGELLILVDDPEPGNDGRTFFYAVTAKDGGAHFWYRGYPPPGRSIAIIDGPPLSAESP